MEMMDDGEDVRAPGNKDWHSLLGRLCQDTADKFAGVVKTPT